MMEEEKDHTDDFKESLYFTMFLIIVGVILAVLLT